MPTLLVVDDEPLTLDCFRLLFPKGRVEVLVARTGAEGVALFQARRPEVAVLDVRLPDGSGLDVFRRLKEIDPKVPVVLITGFGTAGTAIEAMRLGAFEYVLKPPDPDKLREIITRGFEAGRLMRVPALLPTADDPADGPGDLLVGNSPPMQEVYKAIGRVAAQDATVLVTGESGTGKELVARAIYQHSPRQGHPLLAINCAALPEPLLESELFGHERGAFTGADRKRIGKFEQANGGTIFLDEVGDMTPLTQAKVLRVIQEQRFERVGGEETVRTDVRLIAATNAELVRQVEAGKFRRDLYFRLNVFSIHLPPLRDRGEDLRLLVEHFVRRFARELGREVREISDAAMAALRAHPWPGNVRELQSVLKHAILHLGGPVLTADALPPGLGPAGTAPRPAGTPALVPAAPASGGLAELTAFIRDRLAADTTTLYDDYLGVTDRHLFLEVLRHTEYNLSRAARILGISRTTLRARLAGLGLALDRTPTLDPVGDPAPPPG